MLEALKTGSMTDVFLISHGWLGVGIQNLTAELREGRIEMDFPVGQMGISIGGP